jgi:hypothetical protein
MQWRKPAPPSITATVIWRIKLSYQTISGSEKIHIRASQQMAALPYSLYPPQATDWIGFILCGCTMA